MHLLLALFAISANAATITVCASGCTYTTIQAAVTAAARGDIIEPRAGETFEETVTLPRKTGSGVVTVRSSRWAELPPTGTRVTSAHTALMPKMQPPSTTAAVLTTGEYEVEALSMNTTTDTLTMDGSPGWTAGQPIACWSFGTGVNAGAPIPVTENQIYYVKNPSGATLQLSTTPGGATYDLTGPAWPAPSSSDPYWYFRCSLALAVDGYKFQGIEFSKKSGQTSEYNLVQIGAGVAANRAGIPYDFTFDHVYIHGLYQENGPRNCLVVNAGAFSITDSTLEMCNKESEEAHAISGAQAQGPITIRNNQLSAGSIGMIWGGDFVRIEGLVNGDRGGIQVTGNYFTRPFWTKYLCGIGGAGVPAVANPGGTCNYYLRTSNGVLYAGTGGSTWALAPTPADGEYFRRTDVAQNCGAGACWQALSGVYVASTYFRAFNYYTKNQIEIKSATNLNTSGNWFENNWNNADQAGHIVLPCALVAQGDAGTWVTVKDSIFQLNKISQSSNGLRCSKDGSVNKPTLNIENVVMQNNLLYKIGNTDYPSIDNVSAQMSAFGGIINDSLFNHNTMSSWANVAGGFGIGYDTNVLNRWRYQNSISFNEGNGIQYDGTGLCTTYFSGFSGHYNSVNIASSNFALPACNTLTNGIIDSTVMFTSITDYRLQATSPYSAKCAAGCGYVSTDGKDLGADIDQVDAATQGAVAGTPWLGGSVQVAAGSTRAIVTYTAPDSSSCTLKLYNDIGRATLNADTDTGPEQADTRSGNVTNGRYRQFVLGTSAALTASTQYWAVINCGTSVGFTPVRTVAAGSGFNWITTFSGATTGNYSSSADMSSPTSACSGATCTVPIPAGGVRYFQASGGLVVAGVAP